MPYRAACQGICGQNQDLYHEQRPHIMCNARPGLLIPDFNTPDQYGMPAILPLDGGLQSGKAHQVTIGWGRRCVAARSHVRDIHLPRIWHGPLPVLSLCAGGTAVAAAEPYLPSYPEGVMEAAAADQSDRVHCEGDGPPCSLLLLQQHDVP